MIIIKSRKQKAEAYEKNYSNIPRDYLERLSWMYDKYHMNINKATEVMKKREQILSTMKYEKEFFIVLYEEPEGTPRPRARYINKSNLIPNAQANPGFIQIYSLTGSSDRKYMHRVMEDNELTELQHHLIYTPCNVTYTTFFKTPSNYNTVETYLAELGLMRPLLKPDFDNIEKKYADMYNGNVWLDDSLVVSAHIDKYYSILPRVEISLLYMNMLYNKHQFRSIQSKLPDVDIQYFK